MSSRRIRVEVITKELGLEYVEIDGKTILTIDDRDAMYSNFVELSNDQAKRLLYKAIDMYFDSKKASHSKNSEIDCVF